MKKILAAILMATSCSQPCPPHSHGDTESMTGEYVCQADNCYQPNGTEADQGFYYTEIPGCLDGGDAYPPDAGCELPQLVADCLRVGDPVEKCCIVTPTNCGVCQ